MLDDYILIFQWLLVAIGAALLLGTGAALLSYRRTGTFPGQPEDRDPSVVTAAAKCGIGVLLIATGAVGVISRM